MARSPLPPFTAETAAQKARMAEDAWNSRDPEKVSLAYTEDSVWRNRSEFIQGRLPRPQMGQGTGLSPDQGSVDLEWEPHRRAVRL